jgi:RNA polymerase sigma-70 factor (ECF subfamily)
MVRTPARKRSRPNSSELSRWFHRACEREEGALQELLKLYRPLLLKLARDRLKGALRTKVAPSDLVQSTIWKATQEFTPEKFRGRSGFLSWLIAILQNEATSTHRHYYKTKKREVSRELPLSNPKTHDWLKQLSASISISDAAKSRRADVIERMQAALKRLPRHYQLVLRLRYFEKQDFHRIAARLDRQYDAVRMLHNRALVRLKKELDELDDETRSSGPK